MSPPSEPVEVLVVGAGPAGMAAAAHAAGAGCAVTVVDTYPAAGGQYHRTAAPRLDRRPPAPHGGGPRPPGAVAAFGALVAAGRITLLSATTIWTAEVMGGAAPFRLHLTGVGTPGQGPDTLAARSVVLATGAGDRVLPFPGWDLPGVFTAGGAQALLKGQGVRVGERAVVSGSGPFLLPVAAALADAGCDVPLVAEAQPLGHLARSAPAGWAHRRKVAEAARYAAALARHRIPLRSASAVTAAAGDGRVEEVTVSRLGPDWSPLPGRDRTISVDAVCTSFGFVPQVGLAALLGCAIAPDAVWGDAAVRVGGDQQTTAPGVFAAGEATGVAGAEGAAAEGAIAGLAAAGALGRLAPAEVAERTRGLRRTRTRHRRFAAALGRMYRLPQGWVGWLREDTVVCRCEEVEHGALLTAIHDLGAGDLRSLKMTTRCGMGYCQGRMCGDAVAAILARATGAPASDAGSLSTPPVLAPVPLARIAALAADDDEQEDA